MATCWERAPSALLLELDDRGCAVRDALPAHMRPARSGVQRGIRRATHAIPRRMRRAACNRRAQQAGVHAGWQPWMRSCRSARLEAHGVHYSPSQPDWDIVCVSGRPHECLGALIGRVKSGVCVRACVRACIRAVGVEGRSRWAGTRGCGDTSARMCCRQPSAGSSPCVCRTPLSDRGPRPSLPPTYRLAGCAVAGRSAFAAASATGSCAGGAVFRRAQAAHHQAHGRAGPHSAPHPPVAVRWVTVLHVSLP